MQTSTIVHNVKLHEDKPLTVVGRALLAAAKKVEASQEKSK